MRSATVIATMCALLAAGYAAPAAEPSPAAAPAPADDSRPEIIEIIAPAASAQETLATLNLGAPGAEVGDRNKRTIGILRQLFPSLTQIIEQKVQQITSMVLQTLGPVVLRAFLGNRNGGAGGNGGGAGTVELDDDDDDDEESTTPAGARRRRALAWVTSAAALSAPACPETAAPHASLSPPPSSSSLSQNNTHECLGSSHAILQGAAEENQLLSGAESQQAEVRVAFGDQQAAASNDDQQAAAQTNSASIDEITLEDGDDSEENRNKRFLNFGLGGGAGASGGSGGGSGNFIFDIVRLVAGSSSASGGAEVATGGEGEAGKGDNLTEGVPGPITRLFIIANRGIANLIQDLILRLAQTSERIVNFKARLITSII